MNKINILSSNTSFKNYHENDIFELKEQYSNLPTSKSNMKSNILKNYDKDTISNFEFQTTAETRLQKSSNKHNKKNESIFCNFQLRLILEDNQLQIENTLNMSSINPTINYHRLDFGEKSNYDVENHNENDKKEFLKKKHTYENLPRYYYKIKRKSNFKKSYNCEKCGRVFTKPIAKATHCSSYHKKKKE